MGVLEDILARAQYMPPAGAFPAIETPVDEAAAAEEARQAAGRKLIKETGRRTPDPLRSVPDAQSAGIQLALENAPAGTGVPFSTDAGMLAPPVTVPAATPPDAAAPPTAESVPLPAPRPASAPGATDVSSRAAGAPLQIAPVMPPQAAAPPMAPSDTPFGLPSILDKIRTSLGDNSNTLLALGAGFAGAPNIGQGISRAAAAAIPARAADIKQRLASQTQGTGYQALIEAGVPKNLALAAMGNPAIMKSVTENYLGDRKGQLTDIGFDRYGNPIKGIFDPFTKKLTDLNGRPVGGSAPAAARDDGASIVPAAPAVPAIAAAPSVLPPSGGNTDVSSAARISGANPANPTNAPAAPGAEAITTAENDVTGPDYLEHLKESDPKYARQVEQIVNGDSPMPTGRLANTPVGRKLRQDALSVAPGLSDADFATRLQTRKNYTSGNDARVTKSINTVLHHGAGLEQAINDLDNYSGWGSVLNTPRAAIEGRTNEKYQKAKGAYETSVANFAKELDFAVSGGKPTVSGTKHQMEGFDLTAPKVEQMEKLRKGIELLQGRLESHAEGYGRGMKMNTSPDPVQFIEPRNQTFYKRMMGTEEPPANRAASESGAPAAAPLEPIAVNKTTGERRVFRNGAWQPLQ